MECYFKIKNLVTENNLLVLIYRFLMIIPRPKLNIYFKSNIKISKHRIHNLDENENVNQFLSLFFWRTT